ncbi:MAG: ATPase, partial [Parcubacteria group bacterium CG_4_10_14_0_8_um_filter_35_7]
GEPTEKALLMAAVQAGLDKNVLEKEFPRIDEISFDAEKKYMATLHKNTRTQEHKNTRIIYMKGAPEKILEMSKFLEGARGRKELSPNQIKGIQVKYESLTSKGLRVLAVAYKETEKPKNKETKEQLVEENIKDLVFVGLVGLKDPLRPEAKETIKLCRQAGLRPVIVTGDHRLTAQAVAQEVGFTTEEENILEGKELDKMSDEDLKKVAGKIDIYARVEPKHKLRIIDALQAKGEVVAMTGDGVNDAPALKSADIGVALGSGTDVAKGASDIVILDDNFRTIVQSIERGRVAFENIKKVTLYLLADSFSEIILVGGTILMGFPLPILPAQILWINLIEDGLPNIALAFEAGEKEVMKDPPQKITEPILDKEMKVLIFIIGLITDLVLFVVFWWLWKAGYDIAYIRTMIFVMLGLDSLFYVFSCRSLRFTIFHKNPFSNKFLSISVLIGVAFLAGGVYLPFCQTILRTVFLSLEDWFLPITLSIFK